MAKVTVDEDLFKDLIDFKLNNLKEEIEHLLKKWNYTSSSEFLKHTRDGTLSEAEMDAIALGNLKEQHEKLLLEKTSLINE